MFEIVEYVCACKPAEMTWLINHSGYVLTRTLQLQDVVHLHRFSTQQLRFAIDLFHTSQCGAHRRSPDYRTPMDWHLIMQRIERMATTPTVDGDEIKKPTSLHRPSNRPRSRRSLLAVRRRLLDSIVL
jgi:hypothetical protein